MDNMEVFTTVDKAKRDELFKELRKRGLPNERLVVKFSGVQPVLDENGQQGSRIVQYFPTGARQNRVFNPKVQFRLLWQSNFSVAYPRELSKNPN